MFILNKQVEKLEIFYVKTYDEELFTSLFDVTNKIEIRKICIELGWGLYKEDICAKIHKQIRSLETRNIISNEVSCFKKLI